MQRPQIEDLARWWRERGDEIPGFGYVRYVSQGLAYETADALEQLLEENDPDHPAP